MRFPFALWPRTNRPMQGNPDSEVQENFACGIRNPGLWNQEYSSRNHESHCYSNWTPLYGHPLNTDTSLLRTVCFVPGESPCIFSKFNPLIRTPVNANNRHLILAQSTNFHRKPTSRSKPPPTCEKRLLNFGYQKDDLRKLYLLPFEVTKEVKLSMFQYKIIHNILCTKGLLFKMKKEDSPRCLFCPADHTIIHLFTECAQATLLWKEFLDWASRMVNSKLSLSIKEIMFGIINNDSKFCLDLNHLFIIGKYFL